MFVLSDEQVSFILDDIKRNGIGLEELQLNLLDHICCIIENEMPPGENFEEFYRKIIPRFFKRRLGEIQEETELLLTFKHYYAMKKAMLYSGTFAAIGVIAGSIFKVMHWPGASAVFLLAVFILSFIFLPILFLIKVKEVKVKREKIILGLATSFGILASLSTLFKVMHWPGARIMWLLALGILFFLFLPIYYFGGIRNPETKMNTIVSSVLILFAGGLLFLLTSIRPSQQIHHLYAVSIEEVDKSCSFITKQNELRYSSLSGDSTRSQPDLLQLRKTCDALCVKIKAAKDSVISSASPGGHPTLEILLAAQAHNYDIPLHVLFTNTDEPKELIKGIRSDVQKLNTLLKEKFQKGNSDLLDISDVDSYDDSGPQKITWEKSKFCRVPFELVLLNFNQLELDVRTREASCL
jgi:hypothetical protein